MSSYTPLTRDSPARAENERTGQPMQDLLTGTGGYAVSMRP